MKTIIVHALLVAFFFFTTCRASYGLHIKTGERPREGNEFQVTVSDTQNGDKAELMQSALTLIEKLKLRDLKGFIVESTDKAITIKFIASNLGYIGKPIYEQIKKLISEAFASIVEHNSFKSRELDLTSKLENVTAKYEKMQADFEELQNKLNEKLYQDLVDELSWATKMYNTLYFAK